MPGTGHYDRAFFSAMNDVGSTSAAALLPHALRFLQPRSAVDVGCGTGIWAAELLAEGVEDVVGVDGPYVPHDQRLLPPERFVERDLTQPLGLGRTFDLAVCLEVAEHLDAQHADHLVAELAGVSKAVLFSAAPPGQGGTDHVNEQWLGYWIERFGRHGFTCWDIIRPHIRYLPEVAWIYRQNVVVMLGPGHPAVASIPVETKLVCPAPGDVSFEYVARYVLERQPGMRDMARRAIALVADRLRH